MLIAVVVGVMWLAVCALTVGLCRLAARGDAVDPAVAPQQDGPLPRALRRRARTPDAPVRQLAPPV